MLAYVAMASLDKVFKEISVKKVRQAVWCAQFGPSRGLTPLPVLLQLYKDLMMLAQYMGRRVSGRPWMCGAMVVSLVAGSGAWPVMRIHPIPLRTPRSKATKRR